MKKIDNISFSLLKLDNENFKIFESEDFNIENKIILDKVPKKNKKFICEFENCKKVYKSKENLKLHNKNIHLKEKPYSCTHCSKKFSHRNGTFNKKIYY